MNVNQAIEILKLKWNCTIERTGKLYLVHYKDGYRPEWQTDTYTARKLISAARVYTSENNQQTSIKKNVKHFGKKKDRAATRDAINSDRFDDIPKIARTKDEDVWSWD